MHDPLRTTEVIVATPRNSQLAKCLASYSSLIRTQAIKQ